MHKSNHRASMHSCDSLTVVAAALMVSLRWSRRLPQKLPSTNSKLSYIYDAYMSATQDQQGDYGCADTIGGNGQSAGAGMQWGMSDPLRAPRADAASSLSLLYAHEQVSLHHRA